MLVLRANQLKNREIQRMWCVHQKSMQWLRASQPKISVLAWLLLASGMAPSRMVTHSSRLPVWYCYNSKLKKKKKKAHPSTTSINPYILLDTLSNLNQYIQSPSKFPFLHVSLLQNT